ncbi:MAG: Ppx/GppA phosphatase family protein, partial [Hyphomicrobiales bacterium]
GQAEADQTDAAKRHITGQHRRNHGTAKPSGGKPVTKYAALDLGTNNCRLLIAEPRDQGFRIIDSFSRIVRLGEGVSANNRLSDEASDRAISALRVCWNKLKYHKVEKVRLIATEACRSAENGAEFLQRVAREIGLELEIIDRETEARLAVAGCSSLVEPRSDGVVLFDIGGGSSEIVWMDRRGRRKRNRLGGTLRAWDSLPVGVVTLSERYDGKHVTRESFEMMVNEVQGMLAAFPKRRELQQALSRGRHHLLGTSGTVTTLAGVHLGLRRYDRRRVDGMWMSNNDAASMVEQLLALTYEQRIGHPCIGLDRADLVLPGCAIFEAIRREFTCDQLRVADRGLREGILVELMNKDGHGLARRGNRSTPWRRKRPKSKDKRTAHGNEITDGNTDE